MAFDNNISWFQEKIGKYDKASWERVFEEQQQEKGFNYVPKKAGGLKPELIDVDLVNGSTFSKPKPMHGWLTVAREGLLRVILYPLFHEWWRNQTSTKLWLLFLLLYVSEIFSLAIYCTDYQGELKVVAWTEACGPAVVMVLLGILHTHVVSTDSFKEMKTRKRAKVARKHRLSHQKKHSFDEDRRREIANGMVESISSRENPRGELRQRKRRTSETAEDDNESMEDDETENNDKTEEEVSDTGDSTGSTTESDNSDMEMDSPNYDEDPFAWDVQLILLASRLRTERRTAAVETNKGTGPTVAPATAEKVMVSVWEGRQCQKALLSILEISAAIINKVDSHKWNMGYLHFGCVVSVVLAVVPLFFRAYITEDTFDWNTVAGLQHALHVMFGFTWKSRAIVLISMFARLVLSFSFFFLLCVAERSYRQRCLYAKLFGWLTSSRKARRAALPHFRLHKVRNIKTWLSLRSLLKRRGPQRSVDMIVSSSFLLSVLLVIVMCVQLLKGNDERFLSQLFNWEISIWCLVLCFFVLRFITLGAKINRKYRNTSVLLTEQINLYLQMERSPHKKDELLISNNVLKLATKLLKEIESPFKLYGLSMSPLLYNITRVVVLSLFSGVMSDLLGFRLKLWKIKP